MNITQLLHDCKDAIAEGKSQVEVQDLLARIDKALVPYPEGKMSPDDEGGITAMVAVKDNNVILKWEKPVSWVAMSGDDTIAFAMVLIQKAKKAGLTKPVTLVL
jgi:hypothetical protein